MSIVNTTECIICYNEYDTEFRKPCIGTCGHSICEGCKHQMVSSKCPQCNREEAFAITTINYQLLELIKHFKGMQAGTAKNPSQKLFTKGLDVGICNDCSQRSRKLRICVTCALEQEVLKKDRGDIVLNIIDDNIEEAIQKAKSIAICGDCALDGERHECHKTKLLNTLKNSLDDMLKSTVEGKLKTMDDRDDVAVGKMEQDLTKVKDSITNVGKEVKTRIETCMNSLKGFPPAYRRLPSFMKMQHLKATVDNIGNVEATMDQLRYACEQLEILYGQLQKETQFVNENNKAYPTSSRDHPTDDPVLLADRKQIAKEPLVIGVFNPKTTSWQPVGRMPNPKTSFAVASNKSQIYIVGGINNGSWLNTLEIYDKDKKLRRDCSSMKKARARASAGFHDGKLYVAGGHKEFHCRRSVEVYDPITSTWSEGPELQNARADAAVVSCDGELYVLGGFNGTDYVESIEKITGTSEGGKFEVIGSMQGSRAGFGACVSKGRIYVAGGWNNSSNTLKSVRSFDLLTKKWRDEPSMLKARKYFTLHATNEAIYAIRGSDDSWGLINKVERLDPRTRIWEILESVQTTTASTST